VRIEYRWASNPSDLPRYAAELLALAPELILANANPSVDALQKIDRTIPIVFVAMTDPVGSGVAQSLAQPGGNATGFTTAEFGMSGKWLELLKDARSRHQASGGPARPHIRIKQHCAIRRDSGGGALVEC
jgi:putative ABC transport system substrate-binding protein